ncbi:hypothetical protein SAMN05216532_4515 [Streptomyces sp. 2231.1]|nr:hypothetical protein SAMN05216532_4515 [Streptomyces sp. 2231.1]
MSGGAHGAMPRPITRTNVMSPAPGTSRRNSMSTGTSNRTLGTEL